MQLLLVNYNDSLTDTAIAVRNVCNATLSLLFTSSLFIWGLLVNRKQAWRTDGGTAFFGVAALSLALVSTALNFLYVHKENEFVWLPGLMWAVVLWQSFFAWWWWVGAGSGSGFATEDENRQEMLQREAKRASKKRAAREKREEQKIRARKVWRGVTAAFAPSSTQLQIRSRIPLGGPHNSNAIQASSVPTKTHTAMGSDLNPSSISASESAVSQSNSITTTSILSFPRLLPGMIYRWYISLRRAHVTAARQQTAERVHRIQGLDKGVDQQNPWGEFGWRKRLRLSMVNETTTKSEDGQQDPQMVADWKTQSFGEGGITPVHSELEGGKDHQNLRTDHDCQDVDTNHEKLQGQQNVTIPLPVAAVRPSSMSLWGPLRRWRLQDLTLY